MSVDALPIPSTSSRPRPNTTSAYPVASRIPAGLKGPTHFLQHRVRLEQYSVI
ncbi:hypothetical protein WG66_001485 [Moniliophthora roreri]|nr:hypothetical protein WG66_001485 [Moniliophthora roreri]